MLETRGVETLYPETTSEPEQMAEKRGDSMHQAQEVKRSLDQALQSNQKDKEFIY